MKYTILGFQQDKANKLKLNMNDLLLMRTIKDMYSSASMEYIVDNGDKYMWANQNYLHRQIPIIGSKRTMIRIMDKLVDLGLLDKVLKHSKGGVRGNFSYIRPTIKMDNLQDYDPYDKLSQGLRQDDTRVVTKRHNKDTSIRDTSIRDNNNSKENTSAKLTERFETLWKLYPRKQGKKDALKHYKRAVKEGTTDAEIEAGIQSYVGYIEKNNVDKRYVKHGSAWFNQEGWLDDYEIEFEDVESVDDHVKDIFSMLEE